MNRNPPLTQDEAAAMIPFEKIDDPPPSLTCWQKLEAIAARFTRDPYHPSLKAARVVTPSLRENVLRILEIPTDGEGNPTPKDPPLPSECPHVFEQFKGIPISESGLPATIQTILINANITSVFYLLITPKIELAALPNMTLSRLGRCETTKLNYLKRLLT